MPDHLPSPSFHIEEQFVSGFRDLLFVSDLFGLQNEIGNDSLVLLRQVVDASDVFPRDDEEMDRSVGPDVLEDDQRFVLIDDIGRPFAADDLAEDAVLFHESLSPGKDPLKHHPACGAPFFDTRRQGLSYILRYL